MIPIGLLWLKSVHSSCLCGVLSGNELMCMCMLISLTQLILLNTVPHNLFAPPQNVHLSPKPITRKDLTSFSRIGSHDAVHMIFM